MAKFEKKKVVKISIFVELSAYLFNLVHRELEHMEIKVKSDIA